MTMWNVAITALEVIVFLAVLVGIVAAPWFLITRLGESLPDGRLKAALFKKRFHFEPPPPAPPTAFDRMVGRIIIRSFRVLIGALIATGGYLFLADGIAKIGSIPFSQLTLSVLLVGASKAILLIALACLGIFVAFGEGPQGPRERI